MEIKLLSRERRVRGAAGNSGYAPLLRLAGAARRAINLARGKATLIVRKLHINTAQLRGHSGSAHRSLAAEMLLLLWRCAAADLKRCPYRTGSNPVDANSFWPQLLGQRFHEIHRGRLGLGIVIEIRRGVIGLLGCRGD